MRRLGMTLVSLAACTLACSGGDPNADDRTVADGGVTDTGAGVTDSDTAYPGTQDADAPPLPLGDASADANVDVVSQVPSDCPPEGVLFERPGVIHAASVENAYERVTFQPPAGTYRQVRLELEVYAPGWSDPTTSMRHSLFWLGRDGKHVDLLGYGFLVAKTSVVLRHGIGVAAGDKPKLSASAPLVMPETYKVRYVYDLAAQTLEFALTRGSGSTPVATLSGVPNVPVLVIGAKQTLDVDLGNHGPEDPYPNPSEPPQYGWEFRNLVLCLIPN